MVNGEQLALIRTICNVISASAAVATLIGSIYYWKSWPQRSKNIKKEIKEELK